MRTPFGGGLLRLARLHVGVQVGVFAFGCGRLHVVPGEWAALAIGQVAAVVVLVRHKRVLVGRLYAESVLSGLER